MKPGKHLLLIAAIAIIAGILLPTSVNFSQTHLRINTVPGGGGNNNSTESSNSDKTFIYVAGGAILVGIVAYALLRDKKVNKEEESDTTTANNNSNINGLTNYINSMKIDSEKGENSLPVNIFLGVKDEPAFDRSKTYMMGVAIRF